MEVAATHQQIRVVEASQPAAARFAARDAAAAAGFSADEAHRAGLIATELATNLVKHATGGELLVRAAGKAAAPEIELVAIDRGPGIGDVARSLVDGHSTAGSAGTGLGAVRRLADEFDIYSQPGRGTIVFARVRAARSRPAAEPFDVGGISVAKEGEAVCGDAWHAIVERDGVRMAIMDGLGHGVQAREASTAAFGALGACAACELPAALQAVHEGLRHTRGAAGAIARISKGVLKYAGVGNIAGTLTRPGVPPRHVVSLSGTLGHEARHFREYAYPWERETLFVMYSDGLASHWSIDDYRGIRQRHPAIVAAALYRDYSRQRDDVTVVVGREAA